MTFIFFKFLPVTLTMSLLSLTVFIVLLLRSTVKTNLTDEPSPSIPRIQKFKEFFMNMIKELSLKTQTIFKTIQMKAQSVFIKMENMDSKKDTRESNLIDNSDVISNNIDYEKHQAESTKSKISNDRIDTEIGESRNFNNYHASSAYGASGGANYGGHLQTYHHHSIGFDPVNIVVSMSLLSFLLQALQGLLSRTRLPTQIVEARNLNPVQGWLQKFEDKNMVVPKSNEYGKRKYPKKYYA
jgi:hypothetical protein